MILWDNMHKGITRAPNKEHISDGDDPLFPLDSTSKLSPRDWAMRVMQRG